MEQPAYARGQKKIYPAAIRPPHWKLLTDGEEGFSLVNNRWDNNESEYRIPYRKKPYNDHANKCYYTDWYQAYEGNFDNFSLVDTEKFFYKRLAELNLAIEKSSASHDYSDDHRKWEQDRPTSFRLSLNENCDHDGLSELKRFIDSIQGKLAEKCDTADMMLPMLEYSEYVLMPFKQYTEVKARLHRHHDNTHPAYPNLLDIVETEWADFKSKMSGLQGSESQQEQDETFFDAVATLVQHLEQLHIFCDGNARTSFALLCILCRNHGFPAPFLGNINILDGYSHKFVVQRIKLGVALSVALNKLSSSARKTFLDHCQSYEEALALLEDIDPQSYGSYNYLVQQGHDYVKNSLPEVRFEQRIHIACWFLHTSKKKGGKKWRIGKRILAFLVSNNSSTLYSNEEAAKEAGGDALYNKRIHLGKLIEQLKQRSITDTPRATLFQHALECIHSKSPRTSSTNSGARPITKPSVM